MALCCGVAAATLGGCAGTLMTTDGQRLRLRSEEFAQWAEDVFRLQNRVLDALAFALDAQPDAPELLQAEERVLDACADMNELARRRQRGAGTRVFEDLGAARSVPACEAAAAAAAQTLELR